MERNANGTFKKKALGYKKKTCPGCGQYLYLRSFYKRKVSKDHPDGYDCRCKECRRKEKNEWYARKCKVPDGLRLNADGQAVEHRGNSTRLYWGEERTKDFKRLFPFNTNEDMAIEMGCSVRTVVRRAREMGLEKDAYWLQKVQDRNRKLAQGVNKLCGNKADLTNFLEASKKYRFKPGTCPSATMTAEQLSARAGKAWATRKRNRIIQNQ